jgi:general secretion pathway protein K
VTRERGFALLIVLWTMGLLALLVSQFTATGRTEVRVAANLRANAVTQAAADGALHETILRLLQRTWLPDARARWIRVGDTTVEVRIKDQSWKVNPNTATVPVLQALLANLGVEAAKAASLSQAIVDWRAGGARPRPPGPRVGRSPSANPSGGTGGQIFDSLDELGTVAEMTPVLLARMKPFLSVYQEADALEAGDGIPAGPPDASRSAGDGWHFGSTGRVMLVMIQASATGTKGGRFTRQAVVRLREEASLDQAPYQVLTWETPAD